MTHRILLMVSGLFMMFAIYGYIMMIGSLVDESDAWFGNMVLGSICATIMLSVFLTGMIMRKSARQRIEAEIDKQFRENGFLEATTFATNAGVSLDDARDQLDRRMVERGWSRVELEQYNAVYRPS